MTGEQVLPIYLYKGYDAQSGANKKGKIEADSVKAARQKLRSRQQVIVSEIKEEVLVGGSGGSFLQKKTVPVGELSVMTRQFATLQNAHVPLDECLVALTGQVENPLLSNTLSAVKGAVSEGKNLADALSPHPNIFSKLYVNMVKAGESSGNLGLVLANLADFLEYQIAVSAKIRGALTYPLIMILASIGIVAYLFLKVIPGLEKVFISLKIELPLATKILIGISRFMISRWYLIVAGIMGLVFLFNMWYRSKDGRKNFDTWLLKAPLIGPIAVRLNVSKFTKTLSTLLGSGVPIINSLDISRKIITNTKVAQILQDAKDGVQEGETLWSTIEQSQLFPSLVTYMIRTGERTGELEQMLKHVGDTYDTEVERKIDGMIGLIEPLMLIGMGLFVIGVVAALLVPMLSVMSQMR